MDDAYLRDRAFSAAQQSLGEKAKIDDVLKEADKVYAWLTKGGAEKAASEPAQVHESQKA